MRLSQGTLRPGRILEVLENGKIKASAPGLFMEEDKDNNPPIYPFFEITSAHANAYSTPTVGDEIWLLNQSDNPEQLYWFRKDKHIENNAAIFEEGGEANVEILCNRGLATLYFSDGSGWILRRDQSVLHLLPDGSIQLKFNDSMLHICSDGHVELGMMGGVSSKIVINNGSIQIGASAPRPACYGDATSAQLDLIKTILLNAQEAAGSSTYTSNMAPAFAPAASLTPKLVESTKVKID
jgi:hypothetical protein